MTVSDRQKIYVIDINQYTKTLLDWSSTDVDGPQYLPPICTSGSDIKHLILENVDDMHFMLSTSKSVQYLTEKKKKKINIKIFTIRLTLEKTKYEKMILTIVRSNFLKFPKINIKNLFNHYLCKYRHISDKHFITFLLMTYEFD